MSREKMKWLKECLMCCVEAQMQHLDEADTEELGEAIDMIKDLEEAIYYATVTEAMQGSDKEEKYRHKEEHREEGDRHYAQGKMYYSSPMMHMEDPAHTTSTSSHEGRSPASRRMYMEAKQTQTDKAMQLRELEKYMQELTNDIVEMIQDSSPEEKSYLEKKMTTLAAKIGQMK